MEKEIDALLARTVIFNGSINRKEMSSPMKSYKIAIGSPVDYDELVAEIIFNNVYIAVLQMENGKDNMIIEFSEESALQKVPMNDFVDVN
jgi:hypothetical protein